MKKLPQMIAMSFLVALTFSCSKDRDDEIQPVGDSLEVENFVYRAMNFWYLYKPNVPVLADDRFTNQEELDDFLDNYNSPEDLFDNGVTAPRTLDRFSIITADYRELERGFAGVSLSNGMDFGLSLIQENSDRVVGFVHYVLPNTSAEARGVERGMLFTEINGTPLTVANYIDLIQLNTYTLTIAEITAEGIAETGQAIELTKEEYTENPVFITKTFDDIAGQKVGYLMYNSFTANFDNQLNAAFGNLKAEGITQLILDLRYNGGGSVRTATDLAAMITGQFPGELFAKSVYNPQIQAALEAEDPTLLERYFNTTISDNETPINSLNLNKVYVITADGTASASELVINGLDPYIDVRQVGDTTVGKFQASVTLYDSENFDRAGVNPNHFYALQPLILTTANANGTTGFVQGLNPEVPLEERVSTYGILGDENEPLLKAALDEIRGGRAFNLTQNQGLRLKEIGESGMDKPMYQRMYVETPKFNR